VHRDIKPENIMLRPDGYVKVLDFGLAKLAEEGLASEDHELATTALLQTRPGLIIGTVRYMSPEQARGQKVDARSDIWSLGVVLYEMVGGSPPFQARRRATASHPSYEGATAFIWRVADVPLKLEAILQKALRKDRMSVTRRAGKCSPISAVSRRTGTGRPRASRTYRPQIKRHKRGVLLMLVANPGGRGVCLLFFFLASAPSTNEKSIARSCRLRT
jgi:serine/threonine protein kinase